MAVIWILAGLACLGCVFGAIHIGVEMNSGGTSVPLGLIGIVILVSAALFLASLVPHSRSDGDGYCGSGRMSWDC